MKRWLLWPVLAVVAISPVLWGASVSQQTRGTCSPAVADVKGNVTITCTGIDIRELNKLVELFNSSVQLTKEFYEKTLDALAKKQLSTEEIQAVIALRYKAIFASTEENAQRWGKRLDSASDRQSEVDSLAADGKKLAERISLEWQPVYEFVLKLFDDRVLELDKRGLLKPPPNFVKRGIDLIAVDQAANNQWWVRDVSFPNGGLIRMAVSQGQVHRGRFMKGMALWINERVNGVAYNPLNINFDMKTVSLYHRKEPDTKPKTSRYSWESDPLNNEQFRRELSLAIGHSLEFVYLNDRPPTK